MKTDFSHLHVHSHGSVLDGMSKPKELIERVKEFNQPAIAITDHGTISQGIQLYKHAIKVGIKPLIGMEAYISPTDNHTLRKKLDKLPPYYHLTLLAKNASGVSQLYQLSSIGFTEGFYYKPRVSLKLIKEIGTDLIVMGACARGPVSWHILQDDIKEAKSRLEKLERLFRDRFYVEMMDHGLPFQEPLNSTLRTLCEEYGIPWIPTQDSHFTRPEDHYEHSLLMCLQYRLSLEELKEKDMVYPKSCYITSTEEMIEQWGEEACQRTQDIVNQIDIHLELNKLIFPEYQENR